MDGLVAFGQATAAKVGGEKPRYEISAGYRHRERPQYFNSTAHTDDWQKEVYQTAREILLRDNLRTVYDVGCGGGYKLVHMLGEFDTTGIDVPETIAVLKERYPDRKWLSENFETLSLPKADLVICSDVVEHVENPDSLMRFLVACAKKWIVISTPDRNLVYPYRYLEKNYFGPPTNPTHMREWTMPEFRRYVGRFATVVDHCVSNKPQATQMIVAQVRS